MKLAHIAPAYPYRGGISHFATRLARQLDHENLFINFKRLYPEILFPGKTQFDLSSAKLDFPSERIIDPFNPISWLKVAKRIRSWGAEAVILHWWHPFFGPAYYSILKHLPDIPKILICHNILPHDRGGLWQRVVKGVLNHADGVVVHAKSEEAELLSILPQKERLRLFHPVYDIFPGSDIPRQEARERLKIEAGCRMLLYFGLIRPYKGVEVLIEAVPFMAEMKDLKLFLVGEIYENKESIISRLSRIIQDRIELIDKYIPNEEVALWFRAADLVVLPYLSATQSGIIPIAYACERPVLATTVGGLPEVVEEGVSGYLVPPANAKEIARKVTNFFKDADHSDLTEGVKSVRMRLSWESYAEKLEDFIYHLKDSHADS